MEDKNIELYGKISKFPKNTKAEDAYNFLEKIKISKQKLWYFLIERDVITDDQTQTHLQMIKYNNKQGVDCKKFVEELKNYYRKNPNLKSLVEQLIVEGKDDFSIIRNIPDVMVGDVKFITILTQDLIKLLK